ncbi:MAG: hypothetical protein NZ551_08815 [Microscillaceae bacterium]|nr:hypothetical protein [Microscillaceae bacterium]MDW8461301.1 hypothetical protein [Cytophagales bacterium]
MFYLQVFALLMGTIGLGLHFVSCKKNHNDLTSSLPVPTEKSTKITLNSFNGLSEDELRVVFSGLSPEER